MPRRDKSMVAWVGLRGAVPIVLATFPLLAGVQNANLLFNAVFFIVLTSVLLQGITLTLVARWLGVREEMLEWSVYPVAYRATVTGRNDMAEVNVGLGSEADGRRIMDLKLPPDALLILVPKGEGGHHSASRRQRAGAGARWRSEGGADEAGSPGHGLGGAQSAGPQTQGSQIGPLQLVGQSPISVTRQATDFC